MKNKNTSEVLEKDYERYRILLPWQVVLRGKSESYVYSELEKRHPCFSRDWFVKSKAYLGKNGFKADVIVMNKLVLAEYKQKAAGRLFIRDKEKQGKKRFFSSAESKAGSKKNLVFAVLLCLLSAIVGTVIFKAFSADSSEAEILTGEKIENYGALYKRNDAIGKFMDLAEKNEGRFDSFIWKSDGKKETFTANVNFLYPEILEGNEIFENRSVGSINYKDGNPVFELTLLDWCKDVENKFSEQNVVSLIPECEKIDRREIRNIFNEYKVKIQEEKIKSCSFSFSCESFEEKNGENFFGEINNYCRNHNIGIQQLSVQKIKALKENDGFSGQMVLNESMSFYSGIRIEPFAWRTNLLIEKNQISKSEVKNIAVSGVVNMKTAPNQLGEIRRMDGTRVVFYKGQDGKIKREEKLASQ